LSINSNKPKKRRIGSEMASKLPKVVPHMKCRLKLIKLERIQDWLLMDEEFLLRSNAKLKQKLQVNDGNEENDKNEELLQLIRGWAQLGLNQFNYQLMN
jgi:26S proteasome regulatory subunit T2